MNTYCKLTSKDLTTRGGYIWRPLEWHAIPEENRGGGLCSPSYFHFYRHPLQAAFFNCVHAAIEDPPLWEIEVRGEICHEFDKSGSTELMLKRELPFPVITTAQRVAVAILFVKGGCKNKKWNEWADRWLSGEDRSKDAAYGAKAAEWAEWAAARAAVWAAAEAARAAAEATRAAAAEATLAVGRGAAGSEPQQERLVAVISEVMADQRFR